MDTETWRFINSFAPWLSAIGTILAVITSLYLARTSRRIRLQVRAGRRTIVGQGFASTDVVSILITNRGHRVATIQSIGWKIGFFRKQHFLQIPDVPTFSAKLPQKLEDGESASYVFSMNPGQRNNWVEQFKPVISKYKFPQMAAFSMKVQVHTSVGKTFEARIERNLRVLLTGEKKTTDG